MVFIAVVYDDVILYIKSYNNETFYIGGPLVKNENNIPGKKNVNLPVVKLSMF